MVEWLLGEGRWSRLERGKMRERSVACLPGDRWGSGGGQGRRVGVRTYRQAALFRHRGGRRQEEAACVERDREGQPGQLGFRHMLIYLRHQVVVLEIKSLPRVACLGNKIEKEGRHPTGCSAPALELSTR